MMNEWFFVVIGIATYAYMGFRLNKAPDPSTQYGFSLNAMLAGLIAVGTVVVAIGIVWVVGIIGYLIVAVAIPPIICKVAKMMMADKKVVAA